MVMLDHIANTAPALVWLIFLLPMNVQSENVTSLLSENLNAAAWNGNWYSERFSIRSNASHFVVVRLHRLLCLTVQIMVAMRPCFIPISVMLDTLLRTMTDCRVWFPGRNTKVDPEVKYSWAFFAESCRVAEGSSKRPVEHSASLALTQVPVEAAMKYLHR